jgi:hypothetical protein
MEEAPTGRCACGSVRYRLSSAPFDAGWCHCRICQLVSGTPAMAFATLPQGDLVFTEGGDKVKTFASSSFGHRLFCGECGTPIAMKVAHQPETIDFTIATLDNPDTSSAIAGSAGSRRPTTGRATSASGRTRAASTARTRPSEA